MQARAVGKCEDPAQQRPLGHFETPENTALMASNCSGHKFVSSEVTVIHPPETNETVFFLIT